MGRIATPVPEKWIFFKRCNSPVIRSFYRKFQTKNKSTIPWMNMTKVFVSLVGKLHFGNVPKWWKCRISAGDGALNSRQRRSEWNGERNTLTKCGVIYFISWRGIQVGNFLYPRTKNRLPFVDWLKVACTNQYTTKSLAREVPSFYRCANCVQKQYLQNPPQQKCCRGESGVQ